jgi:hypothetical protein
MNYTEENVILILIEIRTDLTYSYMYSYVPFCRDGDIYSFFSKKEVGPQTVIGKISELSKFVVLLMLIF